MRARAAVVFALAFAGAAAPGCRRPRDPSQDAAVARAKIAQLGSPDPGVRRDAAKELSSGEGPPPDAVGPLVQAAQRESVPRALQAELVALGMTGAPAAEPVIQAHVEDADKDTKKAAQKALKTWRTKNGQVVRRDVETQPAAAAAPSADRAGDACGQFKDICAADAFAADRCKADLASFDKTKLETWADCVNASNLSCQKAHDACVLKIKKGP